MQQSFSNSNKMTFKEQYINKIICGDSLTVMRQMPDECLDLVVTSPPYNLKNSTGNGMKAGTKSGKWAGAALQNGYSRVRHCAQARAIENECFVAIAGCVGNLPKVHNMDIQYGQAMVFTPCDFAFPTNGVKAEATPNTEMILIADVDLDLLNELNQFGSVRNLRDRRKDIYSLARK